MKRLLISIVLCFIAIPALALDKSKDFNPADPAIWQEKPERIDPRNIPEYDQPCRIFQPSVCPDAYDSQTDIQREKQRRRDKWWDNQIDKHGLKK